jgi:hypothetical protein
MTPEDNDTVHDWSRIDAHLAAQRKATVLHAIWRPMAAGAAGAALMMGCVWLVLPKVSTREVIIDRIVQKDIEVPKVTMRDVTVPNIVPHDTPVDHVIQHDVEIPVPRVVETAPPVPAPAPSPIKEQDFIARPDYQAAEFKGRIIASVDGHALSFEGGKSFWPAHLDPATSKPVIDPEQALDSARFVGDLGLCRQDQTKQLWLCVALHDGRELPVPYKSGTPS